MQNYMYALTSFGAATQARKHSFAWGGILKGIKIIHVLIKSYPTTLPQYHSILTFYFVTLLSTFLLPYLSTTLLPYNPTLLLFYSTQLPCYHKATCILLLTYCMSATLPM